MQNQEQIKCCIEMCKYHREGSEDAGTIYTRKHIQYEHGDFLPLQSCGVTAWPDIDFSR